MSEVISRNDLELTNIEGNNRSSLSYWASLYFHIHVLGSPNSTIGAKKRDLNLFINFFRESLGSEVINLWTPATTKAFQGYLLYEAKSNLGKPYKATSVSRIMSTLKHFARWVHKEKPFITGHPFHGIKIIEVEDPIWNGLTDKQILRLKSACEHRIATCKQQNQNPLLEATVFYILLNTGLRESELAGLNYSQYHHRGFHEVNRSKSKKVSRKVPLPQEAREYLDRYLATRTELFPESPLLITKYGNRMTRFEIIRICKRISKLANAYLEDEEKFNLTPHMLRHSFLKRIADKHDIHIAQKMSGNVSIREIFRYTQPSEEEVHNYAEMLFGKI